MFYVYVLKSLSKNWFYIGMTINVDERLIHHNKGFVSSTKFYKPFKLVFSKKFKTRLEAREYEKYLKIRSNKEKLLKLIGLL